MLETILATICVIAVIVSTFQFLSHRQTKRTLREYKALFELSDQTCREFQRKIETLLEAANQKDVLLERGANAITLANTRLQEQMLLVQDKSTKIEGYQQTLLFQEEQYKKLLNQKKSSEVRTGKITEQILARISDNS